MSPDFIILAEADGQIGSGHYRESITIAEAASAAGWTPLVALPRSVPTEWFVPGQAAPQLLNDLRPETLSVAAREWVRSGARGALTNLRRVTNDQVKALTVAGMRVLCLDELGDRELDCSGVINASPAPSRHRYTSRAPGFQLYTGPAYIALSPAYQELNAHSRSHDGPIRSVMVSMGGVDRTDATSRIVQALLEWESTAERHIVLGPGFGARQELEDRLKGVAGWTLHRSPPLLDALIAGSDVGITAGGNTLFEMACAGTPAIVLYEDPHEADHGRALEAEGFCLCPGAGVGFDPNALRAALQTLNDPVLRRQRSDIGKRLVDGRGAARICKLLAERFSIDSSVAT